jgi:hypothetical protein
MSKEEEEIKEIEGYKIFLKKDFEEFKKGCEDHSSWDLTYNGSECKVYQRSEKDSDLKYLKVEAFFENTTQKDLYYSLMDDKYVIKLFIKKC